MAWILIMMRSVGLAAVSSALVTSVLTACSEAPVADVFNNAGVPIVLRLDPDSMFGRRSRTVQPGKFVRVFLGEMRPPGALISSGGCDFGYEVKVDRNAYIAGQHNSNPPINIQVEPDMALVLLPADAKGIMSFASLETFEQSHGFPVKPVFKHCRG